jgi:hypothetical protein
MVWATFWAIFFVTNPSSHPVYDRFFIEREKKTFPFDREQGCQMVSFQTQNTNFGTFWKA